jgi:anthranilate synthase component 2
MKVLIIDNYDSFVYNLAQYVGELGALPIVVRNNEITLGEVLTLDPDAVIISPGPGNPANPRYFGISGSIIKELSGSLPILGVCLGHQGIVHCFGGAIIKAKRLMHGKTSMVMHNGEDIFEGVKNPFRAMRYHSLAVHSDLPSCLVVTAISLDDNEIMGIKHREYQLYGLQFHPESIFTEDGKKILFNFLSLAKK